MSKGFRDLGSSFVEIIVAVVILGVISASLLGGLNSVELVGRKAVNLQSSDFALDSAAEIINAAAYRTCSSNLANPYVHQVLSATTPSPDPLGSDIGNLPDGVKITSVDGLLFESGSPIWKHCGQADSGGTLTDYWPNNRPASLMQRIIVTYTKQDGSSLTRSILKVFRGLDTEYGNAGSFKVQIMDPKSPTSVLDQAISVKRGETASVPVTSVSALPNASVNYFYVPGYSDFVTPSVSGSTLSVKIPTSTTEFRASVDVGAFDTTNGVYAIPASVTFAIDPTLYSPSPSPSPSYINATYPISVGQICAAFSTSNTCTFTVSPVSKGTSLTKPTVSLASGNFATGTFAVDPNSWVITATVTAKSNSCNGNTTSESGSISISQNQGAAASVSFSVACK